MSGPGGGIMTSCRQCRGKGTFVLYRGRGREVLPCTCVAAAPAEPATDPAMRAALLAAFRGLKGANE